MVVCAPQIVWLRSVQPFVAVALKLKEHGHRVRVATHSPFRAFVEQFGLEMFPLGGDPEVLADFAVQSKGAPSYQAHGWPWHACSA